jgi:excinuclease ABC subunit A
MKIKIRGASEHNLKSVDCDIGDGLTVVTGVSGSGKTSLIFDTMYHEARRRFLDVFNSGRSAPRLAPAHVRSLTGIGPTIAVGQNLLNRNPNSTLATASGLHPFLRLLYARFGTRHCHKCGNALLVFSEDEIVERIRSIARKGPAIVSAVLVREAKGSHRTLLKLLHSEFGQESILIDGKSIKKPNLNPKKSHDIEVIIGEFSTKANIVKIRDAVRLAAALGANSISVRTEKEVKFFSRTNLCAKCGTWFGDLEPSHFRMACSFCNGKGCERCDQTGIHPQAAAVTWENLRFTKLMEFSVDEFNLLFKNTELPSTANRLKMEIQRRLDALRTVGLGYIQLSRPSPSLSRGESQRVRIAISLTSRLEDIVHVLDEPTIGQHSADVEHLIPAFRDLLGPVIYVEHDRLAASHADNAIDIGPGAGEEGGEIVFNGTPEELWKAETATGRYFSFKERVHLPKARPKPTEFITIKSAQKHNLKGIDVRIPLSRLTVITGVSGSGKSTLVEHVLFPTLTEKKPIGCNGIEGPNIKPIMVDQKPIGKNPRSNPATYTKLSDIVRDLYSTESGLSASHFSFNRPEGACATCKGMGAVEVKMRYLPSIWIPCSDCEGKRFKDEILGTRVLFDDHELSIADFYELSILEVKSLFEKDKKIPQKQKRSAVRILNALTTIGLGYLRLGQPSPTLSGGEAQRVKLAKFLGRTALKDKVLILDEPSTGLHSKDLAGLLKVLDQLVRAGATIVVIEHNIDLIRAADWIIDLGPGAGPNGGELIYAGPPDGLVKTKNSITGQALFEEKKIRPKKKRLKKRSDLSKYISIKNATANNLKSVNVDFLKSKLTVVTGVSGSGKSSLVRDVLQAEAERRFLETLSLYERQGVNEGPEAPVEEVTGLGVSIAISSRRRRGASYWSIYARRSTVGTATEITNQLNVLFAAISERECQQCASKMERRERFVCTKCGSTAPLASPREFSSRTYIAACDECSGIGHINIPAPEKLIIQPEEPLCDGAMYSPGYYPGKYFCEPTSAAAGLLIALGKKFGFDPRTTSWNDISEEGKNAFLYGDDEKLTYSYLGTRKGKRVKVTGKGAWWGFYRIVSDWDVGETFTTRVTCKRCGGTGLKEVYLLFKLAGYNVHQLKTMTISQLRDVLSHVEVLEPDTYYSTDNLQKALKRLRFLEEVGLGYLHLNRAAYSLSAGEAQRIILASLLGSGLTSLTILLDEPTRGMHPSEVDSLVNTLHDLRDEGNTIIVVEHDRSVIEAADEVVDIGPGPGNDGGEIVAIGPPSLVAKANTITAKWLQGERKTSAVRPRRQPIAWMNIKGAKGNNLQNIDAEIPLGVLTGFCGVSGSGKSTLLIDTIARAIAPKKFTTSVAYEETTPEEYETIIGVPEKVVMLDQGRKGIRNPGNALDLFNSLLQIYSESEDANSLGLDKRQLSEPCTSCDGLGYLVIDMGFLPNVYSTCETCKGTGRCPEAWDVRVHGIALPELNNMTLGEIYELFKNDERIEKKLKPAIDVGLEYLVLHQPSITLSGGEIQRLKIAQELAKKNHKGSLYILDEPTVGQHLEDVERLNGVLHRLVDDGHSVIVIEHHPHILASCDWLIELGPEGGPKGGRIIAEGTPEKIAYMETPTAPYLQEILEVTD